MLCIFTPSLNLNRAEYVIAPTGTPVYGAIESEVTQCDRCSAAEPLLVTAAGSINITGPDDIEYSAGFDAYWWIEGERTVFEALNDDYSWTVFDPRTGEQRPADESDMTVLYSICGGELTLDRDLIQEAMSRVCRRCAPVVRTYIEAVEEKELEEEEAA